MEKKSTITPLILSILSIVFCWIPLAAWVFGGVALYLTKEIPESEVSYKTASIVLAVVGIFMGLLTSIYYCSYPG